MNDIKENIGLVAALTGDGKEVLILAMGVPSDIEGLVHANMTLLGSGDINVKIGDWSFTTDGARISDILVNFVGRDVLMIASEDEDDRKWLTTVKAEAIN